MDESIIQDGFFANEQYSPSNIDKIESFTILSIEASFTSYRKAISLDTKYIEDKLRFDENFKYWNFETNAMSINNYNNASFNDIVEMGLDAVPFIKEILEKGPHPIVHALDLIMPDVFEYKGYISLEENCKQWLQLLRMI